MSNKPKTPDKATSDSTSSDDQTQSAGDGILVSSGSWSFQGAVPEVFDQHVAKSIPGYARGHQLVLDLALPQLSGSGRCYELGCSTGTLTALIAASTDSRQAEVVGLDQVDAMLDYARARCRDYPHVSFQVADVTDFAFADARAIISFYTLQFIPQPDRRAVVERIFRALEPGGIFLLFEKTCHPDPAVNRELTERYYAFKRSQGFTEEEILAKAAALEGVLIPQSEEANLSMLIEAGFPSPRRIFSELGFQGYVAEK